MAYAYAVARVMAMKSKLLTNDDYSRMRKMGVHEMARALETGEYGKEMSRLVSYRGAELVGMALNESLATIANKLMRMTEKKSGKNIVRLYASKWVYANAKLLARRLAGRISDSDLNYSVIPVEPTTHAFCAAAAKSPDVCARAISKITGMKSDDVKKALPGRLGDVENEIDKRYYAALSSGVAEPAVAAFFVATIELMNIRNIMKLKYHASAASGYVIGKPSMLVSRLLKSDYGQCLAILEKERPDIAKGVRTKRTMLENNTEKAMLQRASTLMRGKSLAPVFGYLVRKEAEVRNVRLLMSAKANALDEKFVEENLVI
ncbi:MAG: V-type ATPase subunit [Candidatus Aenigmarchaeota archaeon]|nr:V-type ATPase subunit [Candidatus Aenigmarchaeota archaeon]